MAARTLQFRPSPPHDDTSDAFYKHTSAKRVFTDSFIADTLRKQYPDLSLTIVPVQGVSGPANFLAYASTPGSDASYTSIEDHGTNSLKWRTYIAPTYRPDRDPGIVADNVKFGKYLYRYKNKEFLLYIVDGRDGTAFYSSYENQYVLGADQSHLDALITAATMYSIALHEEIWVFDGGYWQKSKALYQSIASAGWDKVILDADKKQAIRNDIDRFFGSREKYDNLKVPWRRGVIYYGPPGNGKTISIKAIIKELDARPEPIPTLYVRTLASFAGPEYAIKLIFQKARQTAPCLLVFEDLDSFITNNVKSYFYNEIDGLQTNDGIMIIGSTNYLERLDPGIAKRPSRFDRKFEFPKPDLHERTLYAEFWRHKLEDNKDIEFPLALCGKIAKITDAFSFAYIQEAFVASLLAIAAHNDDGDKDGDHESNTAEGGADGDFVNIEVKSMIGGGDSDGNSGDDLEQLILWQEMQKQVKILREEMDAL